MKTDEAIDALVRRKIETQKRTIVEGSDEWEVLYRKYYEEEVGAASQGDAVADDQDRHLTRTTCRRQSVCSLT